MSKQLFTNNALSQLVGVLAQGAVSLTCSTGHGAYFPTITGTDFFYLTIYTKDGTNEQNVEVVKVTARTGDVMTIVRDIESMTGNIGGRAYNSGTGPVYLDLRWTAGSVSNVLQKGANLDDLANPVTARTNLGLDTLFTAKMDRTSATGSALIPVGTLAQRDVSPTVGAIRYSSTYEAWEGWNGTTWVLLNFPNSGWKNFIINGSSQVVTRGNTAAVKDVWTEGGADRFPCIISGTTASGTIALFTTNNGLTTEAQGITATITGTGAIYFRQRILSRSIRKLLQTKITCSAVVFQDTGVTQNAVLYITKPASAQDNWSSEVQLGVINSFTVPSGQEKLISMTYFLDTVIATGEEEAAYGLAFYIGFVPVTDVTAKHFYIGNVQIEQGAAPTAFENRLHELELLLCRRYLRKNSMMKGYVVNATTIFLQGEFEAPMRGVPVISLLLSTPLMTPNAFGTEVAAVGATITNARSDNSGFAVTINGYTGLTAGDPVLFNWNQLLIAADL